MKNNHQQSSNLLLVAAQEPSTDHMQFTILILVLYFALFLTAIVNMLTPIQGKYVLWWNYVTPQGKYNGYAAATSSSPLGPFTLQTSQVNITRLAGGAGDFDIFVDDDGSGYLIYSAAFWMSIEKLTPDFLHSTGLNASCGPDNSPFFPPYFVEAPVFFKRNGKYYVLFGHCCCFCYQGSGIQVFMADNPMGPWKVG